MTQAFPRSHPIPPGRPKHTGASAPPAGQSLLGPCPTPHRLLRLLPGSCARPGPLSDADASAAARRATGGDEPEEAPPPRLGQRVPLRVTLWLPQRRPAPARRCGTGAPGGVGRGAGASEAGTQEPARRPQRERRGRSRPRRRRTGSRAGPGHGESGRRKAGGKPGGQRAAAEPRSDMVLLKE